MPLTKNIRMRPSAFPMPATRCAVAARGRAGEASCLASASALELGISSRRRLSTGFATPSTIEQPLNPATAWLDQPRDRARQRLWLMPTPYLRFDRRFDLSLSHQFDASLC